MPEEIADPSTYPFEIPGYSFTFDPAGGGCEPLGDGEVELDGRTPVLAVGSNAAPEQLRRKFPPSGALLDPIPLVLSEVRDLDVVFAARVTRYGAVPATPHRTEGASTALHLVLLTDAQLAHMNATESLGVGYELVQLPAGTVSSPLAAGWPVLCYRACAGPLLVDETPVALATVSTRDRRLPAWTQARAIAHVAAGEGLDADELVDRVRTVAGFQRALNARLAQATST